MSKELQITLVKSLIGRKPKHKLIAGQLGLTKIGKSVIHQNNPAIQGLINKIFYLVNVEEL